MAGEETEDALALPVRQQKRKSNLEGIIPGRTRQLGQRRQDLLGKSTPWRIEGIEHQGQRPVRYSHDMPALFGQGNIRRRRTGYGRCNRKKVVQIVLASHETPDFRIVSGLVVSSVGDCSLAARMTNIMPASPFRNGTLAIASQRYGDKPAG
ncbi:hypothetical protein [Asaia sp. As-1742]|uniref:hypothetical protein n=1 Tax=Asaia sp. As-1742 TaxID=2608325 RepID=UPI001965C994|nr:hypothetical protein [Asaia sp. As-1742]